MSIKEIIKYQKEQIVNTYRKKSSRNTNSISTKSFKRPSVKVQILMLYNSEIFDLLNDQKQRGKIRFNTVQNEIVDSPNYGKEY